MVGECSKRDEPSLVLESRNAIADDFSRLRRHHRPNHRANVPQRALSRFRNIREVLLDSLRSTFASRLLPSAIHVETAALGCSPTPPLLVTPHITSPPPPPSPP